MGTIVLLRPVLEDDLTDLDRMLNTREATHPYNWFGYHGAGHFRRRWAESGLLDVDEGVLLVVAEQDPQRRLGFVSWAKNPTGQTSYCWNIGITLLPEARGRGHGTDAQRQLVAYLFAHTQVNRVEAGTEVDNLAEQRALTKAGFTREGVLRGWLFREGKWRDCVRFSVLRDEVVGR
ncbi:GNAT family protein [Saccharopolyspora sp. NPDC047091]|uniref:GNAT family N-acetyltransferase n=1 Tax=Saccharopolyspora sp. NPDC047091 TaxID=3155924 RepID=UPI0033EE0107